MEIQHFLVETLFFFVETSFFIQESSELKSPELSLFCSPIWLVLNTAFGFALNHHTYLSPRELIYAFITVSILVWFENCLLSALML